MTRVLLALLLASGAAALARPPARPPPAAPVKADPAPRPDAGAATDVPAKAAEPAKPTSLKSLSAVQALTAPRPKADAGVGTPCGACHGTGSWTEVRFNHDRTGFKLVGAHTTVSCKDCHPVDFEAAVPRACSGCHRDVHAGELGARCDGCHDPGNWRSRFDAEAHRRSNFPLLGAHAALPCTECHFEARERRFSRAMVECGSCHQADYQRAATQGFRLDHVARDFDSQRCRECHAIFRWSPARFPEHDTCFVINSGPHAAYSCVTCHPALPPAQPPGTCNTGAQCISCHEHQCSLTGTATPTDQQHAQVPGYQCKDTKCYECHQPTGGAP